jgi:hypothetical protein
MRIGWHGDGPMKGAGDRSLNHFPLDIPFKCWQSKTTFRRGAKRSPMFCEPPTSFTWHEQAAGIWVLDAVTPQF